MRVRAAVALLLAAAGALAQDAPAPGSIAGIVKATGSGQPLAGIKVVARNSRGGEFSAVTAPDGLYRLSGLPAGEYSMYTTGA
jgi:hypothetical protein